MERYFANIDCLMRWGKTYIDDYIIEIGNYDDKRVYVYILKDYEFVEDGICKTIKQVNKIINKYGLGFTEI